MIAELSQPKIQPNFELKNGGEITHFVGEPGIRAMIEQNSNDGAVALDASPMDGPKLSIVSKIYIGVCSTK